MSFFGVIAVAGVSVNDALVLLDRYNAIRRDNEVMPGDCRRIRGNSPSASGRCS